MPLGGIPQVNDTVAVRRGEGWAVGQEIQPEGFALRLIQAGDLVDVEVAQAGHRLVPELDQVAARRRQDRQVREVPQGVLPSRAGGRPGTPSPR